MGNFTTLSVRVSKKQMAMLDSLCDKFGLSRSDLVKTLINNSFDAGSLLDDFKNPTRPNDVLTKLFSNEEKTSLMKLLKSTLIETIKVYLLTLQSIKNPSQIDSFDLEELDSFIQGNAVKLFKKKSHAEDLS